MGRYNKTFELSVEDMDLIETALRKNMAEVGAPDPAATEAQSLRQINDLLGRLHNQKTFFRPASGPYVGG